MMAAALTACSSSANPSQISGQAAASIADTKPEAQHGDTVTVEDMKGTVEIPAHPQRIADVSGLADELIILDMPFIASANTSMFDGITVPDYLQEYFTKTILKPWATIPEHPLPVI